jgi:transcriptional regulator GlxA family with amidase domain
LLLRGIPLHTIAEELGFSDAFHLSKTFKQVLGLAPRHLLRDYRQGHS